MHLAAAVLIHFVYTAFALTGQQIADHFRSTLSPGSGVYLPSDKNFANETVQRWNAYHPPTYIVSIKPARTQDVQQIVNYVRQNNLSFLTTGGGHGYTDTLNSLQGGVELDMGNFNNVNIDSKDNIMTTGGAVRFTDITEELQAAGKEIPVGTCSCIGMTGATLGGGVGPYSGLYGPISDSLSSLQMVVGTGEILNVSATENPDLFWGMKGAGVNFGAVTSVTYKVYNATNNGYAMNADMTFDGSLNSTIFKITRQMVQNQPAGLTITLSVGFNSSTNGLSIIANFIYAGPLSTGKSLIQPYLSLNPYNLNISSVPWSALQNASLYGTTVRGCEPGSYYIPYSLNLYEVDVANWIDVLAFMRENQAKTPALQDSVLSLAIDARQGFQLQPQDSSAFPWRDVIVYAVVDGFFSNATAGPPIDVWGKQMRAKLLEGSGREGVGVQVYTNLAHGDEGPEAWYTAEKLPRLRELKKKYDPQNLFRWYNPLTGM